MKFITKLFPGNIDLTLITQKLVAVLSNIALDNMNTMTLEGTTHATADASKLFYHNKQRIPSFVLYQEGDIYIPSGGIGAESVDIRSRNTSEDFKLILVF